MDTRAPPIHQKNHHYHQHHTQQYNYSINNQEELTLPQIRPYSSVRQRNKFIPVGNWKNDSNVVPPSVVLKSNFENLRRRPCKLVKFFY